jgi:cystathionine beta-synthase
VRERGLLERIFRNQDVLNDDVTAAMDAPLPAIEADESVDQVFADLSGENAAVVVARAGALVGVLTRADLLEYLASRRGTNGA